LARGDRKDGHLLPPETPKLPKADAILPAPSADRRTVCCLTADPRRVWLSPRRHPTCSPTQTDPRSTRWWALTLRADVVRGTDMLIVRELTGGLYFGEPRGRRTEAGRRVAVDTLPYGDDEITRVARVAFDAARVRRRRVTSVDKANVLHSSQLWREVVTEVARDYPDVTCDHALVDSTAMQLIRQPPHTRHRTENMLATSER
jgi:hypothetical protein